MQWGSNDEPDDGLGEPIDEASERGADSAGEGASDGDDGSAGGDGTRRARENALARAVHRRDYLRTVGGAGAVSLLGAGASGTVLAQSDDWEAAADDRIQQNRTGGLEVQVVDQNGQAVSSADVSVEMQEHDFHFGTAVNADMYVYGEDKDGNSVDSATLDKYRRITHEKFNTAVLENAHKWKFWEDNQQRADDAVDMLLENELDVRGHVCIWGRRDVGAIPDDVLTAIDNGDAQTIRDRSTQHIRDIISHYGTDIMEWEVVNESMNTWAIQKGIYGDQITDGENQDVWTGDVVPWKSEIMAEWYQTAADVAPDGVGLGINDFNVLTAEYDYADTWFNNWAQHIIDNGVDLDFMGMQSHMKVTSDEDRRLEPSQLMSDLDHFAQPTGSLRVTEFDFAQSSEGQLTQQEAADYFYQFLKTTFSHPAVEQFLMWGFWDALHWSSPWSPMFDENFNQKPGYDVWENLVFDEWWTSESGTTDSSGVYSTTAFLGEHDVTVSTSQGSTTQTVSVTNPDGTQTVTVTVQGDGGGGGCEEGTDAPAQVNGVYPQDLDGDGLHEDLNANCRLDSDDVVTYFEQMDSSGISNNEDSYDFNENGRIDFDDLVTLFESM